PANLFVLAFEANIACVAALAFSPQGNRVRQVPLLQKQQRVAAVEGAVERDAADFQAFFGNLLEHEANDLVRLRLGRKRDQRHGVATTLVQQHGGGVGEKPLG